MIAFLVTIYAALVIVLFKFKLIKPRPYPIAGVLVVGGVLVLGVFAFWMQCAPVSPKLVSAQYVVQLVPYVKGQVKRVVAQPNQPLKQGDLLLEIDPAPYQFAVNQLEAQLQSAKENVNQSTEGLKAAEANAVKAKAGIAQAQAALDQAKAGIEQAKAALVKAKAQDDLAKTEEQIALNLQKMDPGAISVLKVAEVTQKRAAADATVNQSEAAVLEARAAQQQAEAGVTGAQSAWQQAEAAARQAAFTLKVAQSNVPAVQAQLDDARFNLAQCKMYAPADGYVVNWVVQEGTMLVPMPMAAAGTFVSTSEVAVLAVFPQNYLANVEPGNEVELVLDPYPGRLFTGKVENVIPATGGGQFDPSGKIPHATAIGSDDLFAVKIRLTGDTNVPLGCGGTATIYTDHGKPVHIVSKVTIRMQKWLLYVKPTLPKVP